MFQSNLFQINRDVKIQVYCVLFITLLAVGNVWAEDDVVDVDPNGNFTIFGVFRSLWEFLSGLMA